MYCDASVYLSVSISPKLLVQYSPNFLCILPICVAWSSFGGVAVCYVLPVYG